MSTGLTLPSPILVAPPTGNSCLPIVELDRTAVLGVRKQVRLRRGTKKRDEADCSFGNFEDSLQIAAWQFFHAAKKTELTTTFDTSTIDRRAICFAEEHSDFFIWNTTNLRRVDRSVFAHEDFAESGLAGRFGEAIAYLAMLKRGYIYWDRIAVLWERAAAHSGMMHSEMVKNAKIISAKCGIGRPDLEPDFAFEKLTHEVALMEAKGSFVHPVNDNPTTKDDLRHALKQLAAWSGMITPMPAKSFAFGTYFRDQSDGTGDPSLIAYVDPPGIGDETLSPVQFRRDWIRRGNYGAWLVGMGFTDSGNALRRGVEIGLPERQVHVVRLGGRDFAVTINGVILKRSGRSLPGQLLSQWMEPWFFLDELRHNYPRSFLRDVGVSIRVTGIDVDTLRLTEESVRNSASVSLMQQNTQDQDLTRPDGVEGFSGSIFPDGTLYGQMDPELLWDAPTKSFLV